MPQQLDFIMNEQTKPCTTYPEVQQDGAWGDESALLSSSDFDNDLSTSSHSSILSEKAAKRAAKIRRAHSMRQHLIRKESRRAAKGSSSKKSRGNSTGPKKGE